MKQASLLLIITLLLTPSLFAQQLVEKENEVLLQLKETISAEAFIQSFQQSKRLADALELDHTLYKPLNIHLLTFDPTIVDKATLLNNLRQDKQVLHAFPNRKVEQRTEPNDTYFSNQWDMDIIGAPEVWNVTTGGLTTNGDTIVVAVIDSGCDINHIDIKENLWINHNEIPDDGMDNDNNGYIDDYFGYHTQQTSDDHPPANHGTSVAGIVGAKGNNDEGVTGVNWNVKIMVLSQASYESDIVELYGYIANMRQTYNETNGQEGAFVVATNSSFGIPFSDDGDPSNDGNPENFPLWDAMYDEMGQHGILSAVATDNKNVDVDEVSDMPSGSFSDYVITVTNTTPDDIKKQAAGFGKTTIDLGAPGEDSYTIRSGSQYGEFAGTSGATPHVAGAIALLYSVPCDEFIDFTKDNPVQASLQMKNFILNGTDPNASLDGITVTNGRLNVFNSMQLMRELCVEPAGTELEITSISPNPTSNVLNIEYNTATADDYTLRIYNAIGQLIIEDTKVPGLSFQNEIISIDVLHLKTGVYFLTIEGNDERVSERFMVY